MELQHLSGELTTLAPGTALMETVIFSGIQGAGKTTFYKERFFDTHIRISLDMLKTRHREAVLLDACIAAKQKFVVDNTNPAKADRSRYIVPAKQAGFTIIGYYFAVDLQASKERNLRRRDKAAIPQPGLLGTHKRLQFPTWEEGFDHLYYVRIDPESGFVVEEWAS